MEKAIAIVSALTVAGATAFAVTKWRSYYERDLLQTMWKNISQKRKNVPALWSQKQ